MTLNDLKDKLGDNEISYSAIKYCTLINIMKFVNISLEMDRQTFDYYYKIDVDELLNSEITDDEFEILDDQGWAFSDDDKSLILYLKSN